MKKKLIFAFLAAFSSLLMLSAAHAEQDLYGNEIVEPWRGCYHGARDPAKAVDYKDQMIVAQDGKKPALGDIKKAIAQAAVSQDWDVQMLDADAGTGKLVLTRIVRKKHTMVLTATFNTEKYSLVYKSSSNLNAAVCEGAVYIHPNYNRWVGDLNSAIQGKLRSM